MPNTQSSAFITIAGLINLVIYVSMICSVPAKNAVMSTKSKTCNTKTILRILVFVVNLMFSLTLIKLTALYDSLSVLNRMQISGNRTAISHFDSLSHKGTLA